MATPTIVVPGTSSDTSLTNIMNLARALVNDSQAGATAQPGEGQILTDNSTISPFTLPFLNSAIRELYRELRLVGQPTLIKDNVIVAGIPVVNSPTNGVGAPDPAVQTYLGFSGYFDGVQMHSNVALPGDVIVVERVWERTSGTNNVFVPLQQPQFGLPSVLQGPRFVFWEWRNDNINFVGATVVNDLRLRYYCALPTFFGSNINFDTTYVPVIDCADAVAYKVAVKYAKSLGAPGVADLQNDAREQMFKLKSEHVKRMQSMNFDRIPYGSYNNGANYQGGVYAGWQ